MLSAPTLPVAQGDAAFDQHVDVDFDIAAMLERTAHIEPRGIAQGHAVDHELVGNPLLVRTFEGRQLNPVVDALGLDDGFGLAHLDVIAVGNGHAQHVGQVVLALGIAV